MRRVTELAALRAAIEAASREAESAFGDATVYLEQAVLNPCHIEVQILADNYATSCTYSNATAACSGVIRK